MKNLKFVVATVIATSLLGSTAAMAADAITTTDTGVSTPIAKTDIKTEVKAPVKKSGAKHVKHTKKASVPVSKEIKSEDKLDTSKIDSSVKTDSTAK